MFLGVMILAAALPVFACATNSVVERIAGADPAVCLSRFADYPPSKGRLGFPRCLWEKLFPANEKFWLKDVDFSCASPWTDESGSVRAGTLISRRHVIFAKHFALWKGVRILFVDGAGEVCPCRIEATMLEQYSPERYSWVAFGGGCPCCVTRFSTAMTRHYYHENLTALKSAVAAIPTL